MRILLILVALSTFACQRNSTALVEEGTRELLVTNEQRLLQVVYPLIAAASVHTDETRKFYGVTFRDGRLGAVHIDYVHPHMPAALSDVETGDRVIAVNGERVRRLNARDMTELVLRLGLDGVEELKLAVERNGRIRLIEVPGMKATLHSIRLSNSSEISISSNGRFISVSTGLLDFAENDHQLALLLSHEIAHSLLGHTSRLNTITGAHALRPDVAGQLPTYKKHASRTEIQGHPLSQEIDADRLALNIVRDAGYRPVLGNVVWERLASAPKAGLRVPLMDEHPLTPERLSQISSIRNEDSQKAY